MGQAFRSHVHGVNFFYRLGVAILILLGVGGTSELARADEPVALTGPEALKNYCGACHTNDLTSNSFRIRHLGETQILDALARLNVPSEHPMAMPPSPIEPIPGPNGQMQDPKAIIIAYLNEKLGEVRTAPAMPPLVQAPPFSPAQCYETKAEWLQFRSAIAGQIANQSQPSLTGGYQGLSSFVKTCEQKMESLQVKSCFQNVANYARIKSLPSGGRQLGFEVKDADYYGKLKAQGQIDGLALPKMNEGIDLSNGIPTDWREQVAASGNKVQALQYRSRTVPNPGEGGRRSYNRLLFLVQGEKYDKWIQFTLPEPTDFSVSGFNPMGDEAPHQLVDMIAVDKSQTPHQIMFGQYWRNSQGQEPKPRLKAFAENLLGFVPTGSQNFADTCYQCHANGMRQLSPQPASVGKGQMATLNAFNAKMASYRRLDWLGAITPEAYGPAMGKSIGCTSCHNSADQMLGPNVARGSITPQFASSHLSHKLLTDMSMPTSKLVYNQASPSEPINILALQSHIKYLDVFEDDARLNLSRYFVENQRQGSMSFPSLNDIFNRLEGLMYFANGIGTHQVGWPGLITQFPEIHLTKLKSDAEAVRSQRTQWLNQQLQPSSPWYRAELGQWLQEGDCAH